MKQTLLIPKVPSLNQIINSSRANRYQAARDKKYWTTFIADLAMEQNLQAFNSKCWLCLDLKYNRTYSDPDNLQAGCLKVTLDGLVLSGILKGDSFKEIGSPIITSFRKSNDSTCVYLFDDATEFADYLSSFLEVT